MQSSNTNSYSFPVYDSGFELPTLSYPLLPATSAFYQREHGFRDYELTNHLGNVMVVLSDRKYPIQSTSTTGSIAFYQPDVRSSNDYYAFGGLMPGRKWDDPEQLGVYRFGFNGQTKEDEINGEGNSYDFGLRIEDVRLGKFFSRDPFEILIHNKSTYSFAGNSPIKFIDKNGGFQMTPEQMEKYPILKNVVFAISNIVNDPYASIEDPFIREFITAADISGSTQEKMNKVREILSFGSGPFINITPIPKDPTTGIQRAGSTPDNADVTWSINLDSKFVKNLETVFKRDDIGYHTTYMVSTMLTLWHEGIHFADLIEDCEQINAYEPGDYGERCLGYDYGITSYQMLLMDCDLKFSNLNGTNYILPKEPFLSKGVKNFYWRDIRKYFNENSKLKYTLFNGYGNWGFGGNKRGDSELIENNGNSSNGSERHKNVRFL